MTKIIEVIVSPKGETKIETKGFVGGECRQASRFIEQALGLKYVKSSRRSSINIRLMTRRLRR